MERDEWVAMEIEHRVPARRGYVHVPDGAAIQVHGNCSGKFLPPVIVGGIAMPVAKAVAKPKAKPKAKVLTKPQQIAAAFAMLSGPESGGSSGSTPTPAAAGGVGAGSALSVTKKKLKDVSDDDISSGSSDSSSSSSDGDSADEMIAEKFRAESAIALASVISTGKGRKYVLASMPGVIVMWATEISAHCCVAQHSTTSAICKMGRQANKQPLGVLIAWLNSAPCHKTKCSHYNTKGEFDHSDRQACRDWIYMLADAGNPMAKELVGKESPPTRVEPLVSP